MTEVVAMRAEGAVAVALARLQDMVLHGQLLPGEQVRQEQIAEQLGVGRAPLREALNVLAKQGPLVHRPNQGYFVAKRLPFEQAQMRRMLELLENELMVSLEWPDDAALKHLFELHEAMKGYVRTEDWSPILKLNRQFHFQIFGLSPYKLILQQVDQLWTLADPYQLAKLSTVDARARTVEEHGRLLDALRAKDRDACVAVLNEHRSGSSEGIPHRLPSSDVVPRPAPRRQRRSIPPGATLADSRKKGGRQ